MRKIIISAVARNGVIGRSNGEMPWHVKEEFQHFKNTTFGFPIIMGRKTFETLGKPLKGRLNVVITRKANFSLPSGQAGLPFEDVKIFHDLKESINFFESQKQEKDKKPKILSKEDKNDDDMQDEKKVGQEKAENKTENSNRPDYKINKLKKGQPPLWKSL